jgi:hypothetical protein
VRLPVGWVQTVVASQVSMCYTRIATGSKQLVTRITNNLAKMSFSVIAELLGSITNKSLKIDFCHLRSVMHELNEFGI